MLIPAVTNNNQAAESHMLLSNGTQDLECYEPSKYCALHKEPMVLGCLVALGYINPAL